jgi:hypothetical protein
MGLSLEIKKKIARRLLDSRNTYGGEDAGYAAKFGINPSVYSTIKNGGSIEKLISDSKWIDIAGALNFDISERNWKVCKTEVYLCIEEQVLFCKEHAKAMMFVDACEIGKTFTAKHLATTLENCFYVDGSQCKTKTSFIRALSKSLGLGEKGTFTDAKDKIVRYLRALDQPVVIIDEAGDLEGAAFLEIKALWNATDGLCGWYMMGADGLRAKINMGIKSEKVGYTEIFSRFSGKYQSIVPINKDDRRAFQTKLLMDVLKPNTDSSTDLKAIVNKCLANDGKGELGGLRRAESLVILQKRAKNQMA